MSFTKTTNTISDTISAHQERYNVIDIINLDDYIYSLTALHQRIQSNYRESFENEDRIIFYCVTDVYSNDAEYGSTLKSLQIILNKVDISNFFITLVHTNPNIKQEYDIILERYSYDDVPFNIILNTSTTFTKLTNSVREITQTDNTLTENLSEYTANILDNYENFCIMPWIQTQVQTTGYVYPCCFYDINQPLGNSKTHSLSDIFNNDNTKQLRIDLLNNKTVSGCSYCTYHKDSKKLPPRSKANARFANHINDTVNTSVDGSYKYKHVAWDIRFNNTCNLKCRTCSQYSSTSWFLDTVKLNNGKTVTQFLSPDGIFDQYIEHLEFVEQIYFAGGEPLIIQECWDILDLLIKYKRYDVELVYNTNFTKLEFKKKHIFDYWKQFDQVHVGASLDAMGDQAEYWRSGTKWNTIEKNRISMLKYLPDVSFSVDATVSLVNALHIIDFHKDWVEKGLINVDQFNP